MLNDKTLILPKIKKTEIKSNLLPEKYNIYSKKFHKNFFTIFLKFKINLFNKNIQPNLISKCINFLVIYFILKLKKNFFYLENYI